MSSSAHRIGRRLRNEESDLTQSLDATVAAFRMLADTQNEHAVTRYVRTDGCLLWRTSDRARLHLLVRRCVLFA